MTYFACYPSESCRKVAKPRSASVGERHSADRCKKWGLGPQGAFPSTKRSPMVAWRHTFPMRTPTPVLPLLILMVYGAVSSLGAQPPPEPPALLAPSATTDTLEARLMGTWVLAEATTPGTPSGIGIRQKIFSSGRWEMIQKDPKTGAVVFHHGGTYRLDGDILEQKVEFAGQNTKSYIGQVRKFRITIDRETYTQVGIGNPFNEVWKRQDGA
jgi:hypothetical protein